MTILDEIVAHKRDEVSRKKALVQTFELKALPPTRDFQSALKGSGISLIAEIKRSSPSKKVMRGDCDPARLARIYGRCGAAAISVLTDERFFCGRDEFVAVAKNETDVPVLRKEFIIDAYQIYESRVLGADAILLIASILDEAQIISFLSIAAEVDLSCLVETHTKEEVGRVLKSGARIIGINNRDLTTLQVDLGTSFRLRRLIPFDIVTVSESGIQTREDIVRLEEAGFDAALVGESLVRSPDVGRKVREFLGR